MPIEISKRQASQLFACDVAIAVMAVGAWLSMVAGVDGGMLSIRGLTSLRYFTVLSNLLMAVIALVCCFSERRVATGRANDMPRNLHVLRFVGVNGVMLTFVVVMVFLGPTMGYLPLFLGGNFFLHLVVPILAAITLIAFRLGRAVTAKQALLGLLPMLAYAVFYCGNIVLNGVGTGLASNDWYGFTQGGTVALPVVMTIMVVACLVLAYALWFASGGKKRKA